MPNRKTGEWPARWIGTQSDSKPVVRAFRRRFSVEENTTIRVHVTADNRYELFLDGERIGRGSERGDERNWFFETYDLPLEKGEHVLVARIWWLPAGQTPFAQHSVHAGFLLSPANEKYVSLLATGVADWDVKELGGYSFTSPGMAWGTGDNVVVDGAQFAWDFERGEGCDWSKAEIEYSNATASNAFAAASAQTGNDLQLVHELRPATLPPMMDEAFHGATVRLVAEIAQLKTCDVPVLEKDDLANERANWQQLLDGENRVTIPARTRRRILLDLNNYVCAYPEVVTSAGKGATIRVNWQEALFQHAKTDTAKGNRDEIEGKFFRQIWTDNEERLRTHRGACHFLRQHHPANTATSMGLKVPLLLISAEQAVTPTIKSVSARNSIQSPGRERGGPMVSSPSGATTTFIKTLKVVGIWWGWMPNG